MIELLIYGTGNVYKELKKVLNWKQIHIKAFLETSKYRDSFEGLPLYTPNEYLIEEGENFDYIICASIYEEEMWKCLKQLGISESKIISGKIDFDYFMEYPDIYDVSRIIACQNHEIRANTRKIVSRNRFFDMSRGVEWMEKLSLVAGEWAVSYDYMYVMMRVLQAMKPQSILEMGLGQSSKILARYQMHEGCRYDICEQDEKWYRFFASEFEMGDEIKVHIRPIQKVYNTVYEVNVNCYTDFDTIIESSQYEFISIDGPWGSKKISRIDILPHIPQCLGESFCIMLDDYERIGEKNMIQELENILQNNKVGYYKAVYGLEKQFCVITSNVFLTSL